MRRVRGCGVRWEGGGDVVRGDVFVCVGGFWVGCMVVGGGVAMVVFGGVCVIGYVC